MILIPALVIGLLIGLATGGNLAAVKTLRLRWMPLLFVAIFTQIVIFTYIAGQRGFVREYGPYIHIATLLATLLVMSRNLHIRGMQLIMLGAALNALVIIVNGGFMPSPEARLASAGKLNKVVKSESGRNDAMLSNSKTVPDGTGLFIDGDAPLLVLGDIFDVPHGFPFSNVFSIGDVFIALGGGVAIYRVLQAGRDMRASEPEPELRGAGDPVA
jgi:hypothetical protein